MTVLRQTFLTGILAVAMLALLGAPAGHAGPGPRTILVKFKHGVDGTSTVAQKGDDAAATLKTDVVVVNLKDGETVEQGLADYGMTPDVAYAEPNDAYAAALAKPSDPLFDAQWALTKIQALPGWGRYPGT